MTTATGEGPQQVALPPFASFASLRAAHSELLRRRRSEELTPELLDSLQAFVRSACATGTVIDGEQERLGIHSLIDYWVTQLYRGGIEVADATLLDFDPLVAPELDDSLCPYVGLDAFHEAQHAAFFGRERLIANWVQRLQGEAMLVVVGSSGSGKSSVVLGGLLPRLRMEALSGGTGWRYYPALTPGSNPLHSLARAVLPGGSEIPANLEEHVRRLQEHRTHLAELMGAGGDVSSVLVVDQFEQLFTLCEAPEIREAFVENLLYLVNQPTTRSRHLVIITMRTDFESQVARMPELQAVFERTAVRVTAMNASELREAIEKPAELVGLKFEQGIVEDLVRELLGEPAGLPLLQFTLLKLWEQRQRNRVSYETYRRLGGALQALGLSADALYASFIHEERTTARRILLRLVRPGEGMETLSNPVRRDDVFTSGEARDRVERVLERLVDARLVRLTRGGGGPSDDQVEVAHEALVRNWRRLEEWLDEERVTMRRRLRLTTAAEQWKNVARDPDLLWRGSQLVEAQSYSQLNDLEEDFVQSSSARQEGERQRAQRRTRLTIVALTVGLLLILGFAIFAVAQAEDASKQRDIATEQRDRAETQARALATAEALANVARANAEEQRGLAVDGQAEAERQRILAESRRDDAVTAERVAASREQAASAIGQLSTDPELSVLLAMQAVTRAVTQQADAALRQSVAQSAVRLTLRGHIGRVLSATFSPDGKWVLTSGQDGTARIWDSSTGLLLGALRGHDGQVYSIDVSLDGQWLATAGDDGTAVVWDAHTGAALQRMRGHAGVLYSAVFNADGRQVATAGEDGTARIWDAQSGQELQVLSGHAGQVFNTSFSPDGRLLATAGQDGTARVWDLSTGLELRQLLGHRGFVRYVVFSPGGEILVTAGEDETARMWDVRSGHELRQLRGHTGLVRSAAFTSDGQRVVTAGQDGTARVWDVQTGQELRQYRGHSGLVRSAVFSPDGRRLVTAGDDGTARVWDAQREQERLLLRGDAGPVSSVVFSPDGQSLVTAGPGDTASIWDATLGQKLTVLSGHTGAVYRATFSPDGQRLVTAGEDGTARVWDTQSGQELVRLVGHTDAVRGAGFSADGQRVITAGGYDRTARVWDASSGRQLFELDIHAGAVHSVAFSLDGKRMLSAGEDGSARVWSAQTGNELLELRGHSGWVYSAVFSHDGQQVLTAGQDGTVVLWDVQSGRQLRQFHGHTGAVTSAVFRPDGTRVVSTGKDSTTRVWDAGSGQELGRLRGDSGGVQSAAISPDGQRLATAGDDGTIRVWELGCEVNCSLEDLQAFAAGRVTRGFAPEERQQYLHEP